MENAQKQLVDRLKEANNILVTVTSDPSIDQLSAALGFTLALNDLGKHATAVYSGKTPSLIEFLQPEHTIEKNTDSLRDFIISLDKSKADKLRYKVEDQMVKVFITPFRSSITEKDLVFSQGDFNVDVVVAIGVHKKEELDQAITSHGRILHDATVTSINITMDGQLGSIGLTNTRASSLCEILVNVCQDLKTDLMDEQIATAFLTGIVAETERFSNEKTTSDTMKASALLMAAGANQQLVSTKLQAPEPEPVPEPELEPEEQPTPEPEQEEPPNNDGVLQIVQDPESVVKIEDSPLESESEPEQTEAALEESTSETDKQDYPLFAESSPENPQQADTQEEKTEEAPLERPVVPTFMTEPPEHGGTLTANTEPDYMNSPPSPLDLPNTRSMTPPQEPIQVDKVNENPQEDVPEEQPIPDPVDIIIPDTQTIEDLEQAIESPHQQDALPMPDPEEAREAIEQAMNNSDEPPLDPAASLNAAGYLSVDHDQLNDQLANQPPQDVNIDPSTGEISFPTNLVPEKDLPDDTTNASVEDPTAPPPVPPPLMPPPQNDSNDTDMTLPPVNY